MREKTLSQELGISKKRLEELEIYFRKIGRDEKTKYLCDFFKEFNKLKKNEAVFLSYQLGKNNEVIFE